MEFSFVSMDRQKVVCIKIFIWLHFWDGKSIINEYDNEKCEV